MSDYVSVNPDRLKQLADALKDAASLVPDRRSKISNGIAGWDGHWSSASVDAAGRWLDEVWGPILDKAIFAAHAALVTRLQLQYTTGVDPAPNPTVDVPWTLSAADIKTDVDFIHGYLTSGDAGYRATGRQFLADELQAHGNDPAWQQEFVDAGGIGVINDGNNAVINGHVPPDSLGQQQLAIYANGVAALSSSAENGKVTIAADGWDPLLKGDNILATGVMMKFGPNGKAYGSQFLTAAGASVLDWRGHHDLRPTWSPGGVVGTGYVPSGYADSDDDWWRKFGLHPDYISQSLDEQNRIVAQIEAYDPSLSILNVVGDNQLASQKLLTGPDGRTHADQLIQYNWSTPPGADDSAVPSKVIRTATLDRTPPHDQLSAQAAANVFGAGYDLQNHDPRSDYDKDQYPSFPSTLARTLAQVGSAYLTDLGQSTTETDSGVNDAQYSNTFGLWMVQTNTSVIEKYLQLFMTDPTAAGAFQGAVNAQLHNAAYLEATFPQAQNLLRQAGFLNGMVAVAVSNEKYDAAKAKDVANARAAAYTSGVIGAIRSIPLPSSVAWKITGAVLGLGASTETGLAPILFPTNAAATVQSDTQYIDSQRITDMRTYVAQGLADAKVYVPPPGASFVHDGVISPRTSAEQGAFDLWWSQQPHDLAPLTDAAPGGFHDATTVFAPGDDQYNNPK